ncbi:hypothetical protein PNP59_11865 [Halobacterium salinarum]|uniref:hypothetical protein n=1 Tax=Halobacterium salinarum TaxID=2242 RepID=UPI0025579F04|nr:hypothetical protein [Halobacterium salinarum]MDL0131619.1 hypothetical protein [Halobacterium salinarum]
MAEFVHPDIEDAMRNPTAGSSMTVILVLEKEATAGVETAVSGMDRVSHRRTFDAGMVLVEASGDRLGELCDLSGVKSISPEGEMAILA